MKKRILVIDNSLSVCQEIKCAIQSESIEVRYILSGTEALQSYLKQVYFLVIMDAHLSEIDVLQMIKMMRQAKPVPILMLTSKISAGDRTVLLKAGATACIEKPFNIQECVAQAHALIQLYADANPAESRYHTLAFGTEFIIDPTYWQVTFMGNQIELTRKEFDLLYCLASRAGQVVTHEQIYRQVWKNDSDINLEGTIKSHISSLRQKLSIGGKEYIENVRSVGYRFIAGGSNR